MKIGIAQINTTVGALRSNTEKILNAYRELREQGAELVITPELAVAGYPPRDLLLRGRFLADCRDLLQEIAAATTEVPLVVGFPEENRGPGRAAYNSAAWCAEGKVQKVIRKSLLPTYDVFDEDRYFEPAPPEGPILFRGKRIAVSICEDLWYGLDGQRYSHRPDPVEHFAQWGPDLILNLSASPWHFGKRELRGNMLRRAAERCRAPVLYCNSVGGNDELIFDGHSLYAPADGTVREVGPSFEEAQVLFDTESDPSPEIRAPEMEDVRKALVLGLRDYTRKTGFSKAVIGLSGGIDSAVTAAIAVDALGAENVRGITLPSSISSSHSVSDSEDLARNLGIRFESVAIAGLVEAAEEALSPLFTGTDPNVAEENIQARARGLLLMAVSNKFNEILLTTGNKSEMAVGYCTLYGDMAGGLAVLSDVPKTTVYRLAEHLNINGERIPRNTIDKAPSAELRPDQKDEDSLPPYPVLDRILELYIEQGYSRGEIVAEGFDPELVADVVGKVDRNEYKRKQAAPGLKITPLAFGIGRRIPIVQKYVP
ncbi:NAD+ synthase [Puniceicoccus vermicola]|uniref:Glutamine-dependent NAD(+) synthetase n=1 Tax=Puniceicoccus vermicola TaxID=388746 RepID=A0A7X1B248_9BACT|nr:NAD+ synthase [Puniceicoccus vermicola]MBC2604127.1 NAD+ synthase [Puniceicoccus vermicola]